MAKIKKSVFDTGPFIHLNDIGLITLTKVFQSILITKIILEESREIKAKLKSLKNIEVKTLSGTNKDFSQHLIYTYDIDLGEASAIALCKQEKVNFFFTDDLQARETAKILGFEPHGTLAILMRAYKLKELSKKQAKSAVESLYRDSSLYLTKDLFEWVIKQIDFYKP